MTDIEQTLKTIELANKKIKTQNATIDTLMSRIRSFEQKESDTLQVKRGEQWEEIKNKLLPSGTDAETERALRTEWDDDPHGFASKHIAVQNQDDSGLAALGIPFVDYVGDDK